MRSATPLPCTPTMHCHHALRPCTPTVPSRHVLLARLQVLGCTLTLTLQVLGCTLTLTLTRCSVAP